MKVYLLILLSLSFSLSSAVSETLSETDRRKMLEKLEAVFEEVEETSGGRIRSALSAFRSARNDDDKALELYLRCVEKKSFIDEKKKNQEFREWKRQQSEKFKRDGFTLALRHQLNWLVLTIEADGGANSANESAIAATKAVGSIMSDLEQLKNQKGLLSKNVYSTPFASTYKIAAPKKEDNKNADAVSNFPTSPLPIGKVYEKVIFPTLRTPTKIKTLRTAWVKRIQQERAIVEFQSDQKSGSNEETSPEFDKFITEQLPRLRWQMEVDLFDSGDQILASQNMYLLIAQNINHPDVKAWAAQFQQKLTPEEEDESVSGSPSIDNL